MTPTPRRTWVPLPAIWYPVWVTLEDGTGADALEEAVIGMVRAGIDGAPSVARELFLPGPLVESAAAALLGRGLLVEEDGRLRAAPDPEAGTRADSVARAGWIAWDPRVNRPLRQIWLEPERPDLERPPLPGWEIVPVPEGDDGARFWEVTPPRTRDVDVLLRLLPDAGELLALRPFGAGVDTLDGARVTRLRRKLDDRWERGPVWAPVEHRLSGTAVWRPSVVPLAEVLTELDPAGWDGLLKESGDLKQGLERTRRGIADGVAPGVLKEAGYGTVHELRESARRAVAAEVGSTWPEGWEPVRQAVEEAFVGEPLSRAVGADWRRTASAWADVLDAATAAMMRRVAAVLDGVESVAAPGRDGALALQKLLGPSHEHVSLVWRKEGELADLCSTLKRRVDTIGTRVLAFGVAVVVDRELRREVERTPELFRTLDRAVKERNRVVHFRDGEEVVDAGGFRARVVAVVRALTGLG